MATSLTHMGTLPCCAQKTAAVSRQTQMAVSRPAFVKAPAFTAAAKPVLASMARSAAVKAAAVAGNAEASSVMYETMIVLRPDMSDEQRDQELAKFEAFLKREDAIDVKVTVRGRQRLAYPIKRFTEGIYILYNYGAGPTVSQAVQKVLSTPEAGAELNILRHMTFRV